MGIFSLFGKKEPTPSKASSARIAAQKKRLDDEARRTADNDSGERTQDVQRQAAKATARKIDAIESEMSSEFVKPAHAAKAAAAPAPQFPDTLPPAGETVQDEPPTLQPAIDNGLDFTLDDISAAAPAAVSNSETTPIIEEAAILYANGQTQMVEQILLGAIRGESAGNGSLTVWGMLFDLYQVTGERLLFENLAVDYAGKFERSPPAWIEPALVEAPAAAPRTSNTPTVPFAGTLDAGIIKQLERARNLADMSTVLRLEFARVTGVDPVGCGLLLSVLRKLQKSGHDLILVGAPELAEKIRAIIQTGRRDETEAPWLLLLELLRLLNREADFEETSIDYCITFEVSPPAFAAPQSKVTTAVEEAGGSGAQAQADRFMMPPVIEGATDQLVRAISVHAQAHNPAILDCSQLVRLDFSAAGQLLVGLVPITSGGHAIEMHNVNHFVAALCNVMGLKDLMRIELRKS